jgi:hypothetical protein
MKGTGKVENPIPRGAWKSVIIEAVARTPQWLVLSDAAAAPMREQ